MTEIKNIEETVLHCPECKEELKYNREDFEVFDHPSGTISQTIPAFYSCSNCDWWVTASDDLITAAIESAELNKIVETSENQEIKGL